MFVKDFEGVVGRGKFYSEEDGVQFNFEFFWFYKWLVWEVMQNSFIYCSFFDWFVVYFIVVSLSLFFGVVIDDFWENVMLSSVNSMVFFLVYV